LEVEAPDIIRLMLQFCAENGLDRTLQVLQETLPQLMAELEVEAPDIIRLMLQFCAENGLDRTLQVLQEESHVSLNTVDSVDTFTSDILNGNWDSVVRAVSRVSLPADKMIFLYDQITVEMIELRELDLARALLHESPALQLLKVSNAARYMKLESLLNKTFFDVREAYPDSTKEKRRQQLAQALGSEVQVVPPSRLLTLLNYAVKWQQFQGLLPSGRKFDIFRGQAPVRQDTVEKIPNEHHRSIKFGTKSHAEIARFSPDGQYFATGSVDGFVEVWDYETGRLRKDLKYQEQDQMMMHDESVLCLAFSRDNEMLATGANDGQLKIWKLLSGQCLRRIEKAHTQGITSVQFSKDSTQVLTGSFDFTVRIHGLKSGKALKEFRGHKSYVNDAIYSADGAKVVSCSADGTIKVWDAKSMDELCTFRPPTANPNQDVPIVTVALWPRSADQILVCPRAPTVFVTNLAGKIIKTMNSGKRAGGDFVAACTSPKGEWVYCVGEDRILYCFRSEASKLEHTIALSTADVVGVVHHPRRNLLATYATDGLLKVWVAR
jgi:WD40 repeat-containing protein SMU1